MVSFKNIVEDKYYEKLCERIECLEGVSGEYIECDFSRLRVRILVTKTHSNIVNISIFGDDFKIELISMAVSSEREIFGKMKIAKIPSGFLVLYK